MHKQQLLFLLVSMLLYSHQLLADCPRLGIILRPESNTLVQAPTIMIEGYAESQHIIMTAPTAFLGTRRKTFK